MNLKIIIFKMLILTGITSAFSQVGVGTDSPAPSSIMELDVSTYPANDKKGFLLPRITESERDAINLPAIGLTIYNTTENCLNFYSSEQWVSICGASDDSDVLPPNITLAQDRKYFVASIYDNDYLPYILPTVPANTNVLNADGSTDLLVVVQGVITQTGVEVRIPIASVTGSGTVNAWSKTITVPAELTEDNQSRQLQLSWESQSFDTSSQYIVAKLKSVGGILNAKKLDINAGLGNDYLGVLMGIFQYPYNNIGEKTGFEVRDIPGIPDKMFGELDNTPSSGQRHDFLYLPVQAEDGEIWLNNNLGANYTNINHPNFSIAQQGTSATDFNAFGSFFQWGRKPDGHELINWVNSTTATMVNGTTTVKSDIPLHSMFIIGSTPFFDWRTNPNGTLWANENSANNPCPNGFRVPTNDEITNLFQAANITNTSTSMSSSLKFPTGGIVFFNGFIAPGEPGQYWSSTPSASNSKSRNFQSSGSETHDVFRSYGLSVRCIKD